MSQAGGDASSAIEAAAAEYQNARLTALLALPGNPYRVEEPMTAFDWHSGGIDRSTPITASYRNTQKVRRFFRAQCGEDFHFDRPFMAWMKAAEGKTMGDAADEWLRRRAVKG